MVKAKQGDGIKKLLVRYHLDTHSCNEEKFLSLNNLSPEANLILDKTYLLPIKQVGFDGKSIRTSLGITEFEKAKEIGVFVTVTAGDMLYLPYGWWHSVRYDRDCLAISAFDEDTN